MKKDSGLGICYSCYGWTHSSLLIICTGIKVRWITAVLAYGGVRLWTINFTIVPMHLSLEADVLLLCESSRRWISPTKCNKTCLYIHPRHTFAFMFQLLNVLCNPTEESWYDYLTHMLNAPCVWGKSSHYHPTWDGFLSTDFVPWLCRTIPYHFPLMYALSRRVPRQADTTIDHSELNAHKNSDWRIFSAPSHIDMHSELNWKL